MVVACVCVRVPSGSLNSLTIHHFPSCLKLLSCRSPYCFQDCVMFFLQSSLSIQIVFRLGYAMEHVHQVVSVKWLLVHVTFLMLFGQTLCSTVQVHV